MIVIYYLFHNFSHQNLTFRQQQIIFIFFTFHHFLSWFSSHLHHDSFESVSPFWFSFHTNKHKLLFVKYLLYQFCTVRVIIPFASLMVPTKFLEFWIYLYLMHGGIVTPINVVIIKIRLRINFYISIFKNPVNGKLWIILTWKKVIPSFICLNWFAIVSKYRKFSIAAVIKMKTFGNCYANELST